MKDKRRIQLVTDEYANTVHADGANDVSVSTDTEEAVPPGEEWLFSSEAEAEIDALLRMTADELTAEVDFEGIRNRAVESAKARKAKRGRLRKAASYALFTAASLLLGVSLFSIIGHMRDPRPSGIDALNSSKPAETELFRGSTNEPEADLVRKVEAGTVNDESTEEIVQTVSELFPASMPENVTRLVEADSKKVAAVGVGDNGEEVGYVCAIESSAPVQLSIGEAACVEKEGQLTYYWQINSDQVISVIFSGFEQTDADTIFDSLSRRITEAIDGE